MTDDSRSRAPGNATRPTRPGGPADHRAWVAAFLLGAMAREALGDPQAAGRAPRRRAGGTVLTHCESRVLQYLPTNLSAPEIARELYLSVNTIKTHQRHLYQKLGASSRRQAVEQARALGLLAPSARMPSRLP